AAEDLRVSEAMVWGYHRRGQLAVMYTRNVGAESSRRGPRDARIDRAEWERFKAFLTVRRDAPAVTEAAGDEGRGERPGRGRPPKAKAQASAEAGSKWLKGYIGN